MYVCIDLLKFGAATAAEGQHIVDGGAAALLCAGAGVRGERHTAGDQCIVTRFHVLAHLGG